MSLFNFFKTNKETSSEDHVSFYDLSCKTIDGETFEFSSLRNKKVMIVNVASKCGNTPQYEDLEKLYKEFEQDDFIVLGFPSNDFFRQESGSDMEIKSFCQLNYGVTFPMMSKIRVKGKDKHSVYKWLTSRNLNAVMNSEVKWNFQKYLVNKEGVLVDIIAPGDNPYNEKTLQFIKS